MPDASDRTRHEVGKQLSFALYGAGNRLVRMHKPFLEPLGLTFPQYLAMLELLASAPLSVGQLGTTLGLDSGTTSPLVQRLERAGLVTRRRAAVWRWRPFSRLRWKTVPSQTFTRMADRCATSFMSMMWRRPMSPRRPMTAAASPRSMYVPDTRLRFAKWLSSCALPAVPRRLSHWPVPQWRRPPHRCRSRMHRTGTRIHRGNTFTRRAARLRLCIIAGLMSRTAPGYTGN